MFQKMLGSLASKMNAKKPARQMAMGIQGKPSFKSTLTKLASKRKLKAAGSGGASVNNQPSGEMEY